MLETLAGTSTVLEGFLIGKSGRNCDFHNVTGLPADSVAALTSIVGILNNYAQGEPEKVKTDFSRERSDCLLHRWPRFCFKQKLGTTLSSSFQALQSYKRHYCSSCLDVVPTRKLLKSLLSPGLGITCYGCHKPGTAPICILKGQKRSY